jgi:hypothetical protein
VPLQPVPSSLRPAVQDVSILKGENEQMIISTLHAASLWVLFVKTYLKNFRGNLMDEPDRQSRL